jgi:hypothetical protein
VFRNTLRCIKSEATDGYAYNALKAKDAAWGMAEGYLSILDLTKAVLDGDKENSPEMWDPALLPQPVLGLKPEFHRRRPGFVMHADEKGFPRRPSPLALSS